MFLMGQRFASLGCVPSRVMVIVVVKSDLFHTEFRLARLNLDASSFAAASSEQQKVTSAIEKG
jgi:hypothetical protein